MRREKRNKREMKGQRWTKRMEKTRNKNMENRKTLKRIR